MLSSILNAVACKFPRPVRPGGMFLLPALLLAASGLLAAEPSRAQVVSTDRTSILFQKEFAKGTGKFTLSDATRIVLTKTSDTNLLDRLNAAGGLMDRLRQATGLDIKITTGVSATATDIVLSHMPDADFSTLTVSAKLEYGGRAQFDRYSTTATITSTIGYVVRQEGYKYKAGTSGMTVQFIEDTGGLRAIQSLINILVQDGNDAGAHRELPAGTGIDYPNFSERGMHMGSGGYPMSAEWIIRSIEKFALHKMSYIALNLNGDVKPLGGANARGNFRLDVDNSARQRAMTPDGHFYTREDWDRMEDAAAKYGIKIVPLINSPGHSNSQYNDSKKSQYANLRIVRRTGSRINGGYIDVGDSRGKRAAAVLYMSDLWGDYLDWFRGDTLHLGGDETGNGYNEVVPYLVDLKKAIQNKKPGKFKTFQAWIQQPGNDNQPQVWRSHPDAFVLQRWHFWNQGVNNQNKLTEWGYEPKDIIESLAWPLYTVPRHSNVGYQHYDPEQLYHQGARLTQIWITGGFVPKGIVAAFWHDQSVFHDLKLNYINAYQAPMQSAVGMYSWYGVRPQVPGAVVGGGDRRTQSHIKYYDELGFDRLIPVSHEHSAYALSERFPYLSGTQLVTILYDVSQHRLIRRSDGFVVGGASIKTNGAPTHFRSVDGTGDRLVTSQAGDLATRRSRDWMMWDVEEMSVAIKGPEKFSSGMFIADLAGEGNAMADGRICRDIVMTVKISTAGRSKSACDEDTWSNVISGTGGLDKKGVGKLILSGTNIFRGGVMLSGGTLEISADNNLGAASGSLSFAGGTLSFGAAFNSARAVQLLGTAGGAINTNGNDVMMSGVFSGSGSGGLRKVGQGALQLSGTNTYAGATRAEAGSLIGSVGSIKGSSLYAGTGATIELRQAADGAYAGGISGTGLLKKTGTGKLALSGASTADWEVEAGILESTGAFSGDVDVDSSGSFGFKQAGSSTYSGVIGGSGTAYKEGGRMTIRADSSAFGGTFEVRSASTLYVRGSLGGRINVKGGGVLLGLGTMNTLVVEDGGVFAPVGIATINGDLSLGATSEYRVNVPYRSHVKGEVSLNSGSLVALEALPPNTVDAAGGAFVLMTVDGGITGEFGSGNKVDTSAFAPFTAVSVEYKTDSIRLGMARNEMKLLEFLGIASEPVVNPPVVTVSPPPVVTVSPPPVVTVSPPPVVTVSPPPVVNPEPEPVDPGPVVDPGPSESVSPEINTNAVSAMRFVDVAEVLATTSVDAASRAAISVAVKPLSDAIMTYQGSPEQVSAQMEEDFRSLSAEGHASTKSALLAVGVQVQSAAVVQTRAAFGSMGTESAQQLRFNLSTKQWGFDGVSGAPALWTRNIVTWGDNQGGQGYTGVEYKGNSFLIGGDVGMLRDWRFGFYAGMSNTEIEQSANGGYTADDKGRLGGLYAGMRKGGFSLRGGISYSRHAKENSRKAQVGSVGFDLTGKCEASNLGAFGEVGWIIDVNKKVQLEPFVGLSRVEYSSDPCVEKDEDAGLQFSLDKQGADTVIAMAELGLHAHIEVPEIAPDASVRGKLSRRIAIKNPDIRVSQSLAATSIEGFSARGSPMSGEGFDAEVGFGFGLAEDLDVSVNYAYSSFSSGANEKYSFSGRLTYRF